MAKNKLEKSILKVLEEEQHPEVSSRVQGTVIDKGKALTNNKEEVPDYAAEIKGQMPVPTAKPSNASDKVATEVKPEGQKKTKAASTVKTNGYFPEEKMEKEKTVEKDDSEPDKDKDDKSFKAFRKAEKDEKKVEKEEKEEDKEKTDDDEEDEKPVKKMKKEDADLSDKTTDKVATAKTKNFNILFVKDGKDVEKTTISAKNKREAMEKAHNLQTGNSKLAGSTISVAMPVESYELTNEDLTVLFNSTSDLSEDFKTNTATLFEVAVNAKINELKEDLESDYQTTLNEEILSIVEQLNTKVDLYLSKVATTWLTENQLVVDNSLKTELTEEFISGLKNLFESSYIDIPDAKVDVLKSLENKQKELTEEFNTLLTENAELKTQIKDLAKDKLFEEVTSGLTLLQKEKVKTLSESINFEDESSYKQKLVVIKESYCSTKEKPLVLVDEVDLTKKTKSNKKSYEDACGDVIKKVF